jgi:phosphohistidine phosphatase SixA
MNRFVLFLLLLGLFVSAAAAQSSVFIVRHAEKAKGSSKDPELSQAGRMRAKSLARMLKDAGITEIYATEFKRTQETAAPLAKVLGLEVTKIPAEKIADLTTKLGELHGKNALVIAHSNTIPQLTKMLGIDASIQIAEDDYDNLLLVLLDKKPRLIRLHYR